MIILILLYTCLNYGYNHVHVAKMNYSELFLIYLECLFVHSVLVNLLKKLRQHCQLKIIHIIMYPTCSVEVSLHTNR